jgi:hypothetical protein
MKHIKGDIWPYYGETGHVVCLTTNGFVKNNGEAVMGRGNALQATQRIEGIQRLLGAYIKTYDNVAGLMRTSADEMDGVFVFPVKHNWWEPADLDLIETSAQILHTYAAGATDIIFHLPRPGVGNGRRNWENEVLPILEKVGLPDNVEVHYL